MSFYVFYKNRQFLMIKKLDNQLAELQKISLEYPYLEDTYFINGWEDFVKKYKNNKKIPKNKLTKYLRYEQYCEMIFNFSEDLYTSLKTEKKILKYLAIDDWTKQHKTWWENPLIDCSNDYSYNKDLIILIKKWLNS